MKGLHLSTSTVNCSVAVSDKTEGLSCVEESEDRLVHAEKLHVFIEQCLEQSNTKASELSYLSVDVGPGSYTGLRIGVSAIKGLAYALQIPIVSMTSPEILMCGWSQKEAYAEGDRPLAMIDARRMEVYQQWGDSSGIPQGEILATILDSQTFAKERAQCSVHLVGDSSEKALTVWRNNKTLRVSEIKYPSASYMPQRAYEKFLAQDFVDTAYFEPFYLKDFVAGKPKKLL